MNKEDAYNILVSYLEEFDNVRFHSEFVREFSHILNNEAKGSEAKLLTKLITLLRLVEQQGHNIVNINGHERLKKANSLNSLHLKGGTYNIRILSKEKSGVTYFLLAFNEKSGKKKTEYSNFINPALERYKEMG